MRVGPTNDALVMHNMDAILKRFRTVPPWQIVLTWTALAVLLAIALIVLAAVSSSQAEGVLRGVADLVKALSWPAAVAFVIAAFREPISTQLGRVTKVTMPGGSIELERVISQQLEYVSAEAQTHSITELGAISSADFDRARAIDKVATTQDLPEIRNRMLDLASEYRRVRGAMPSGDTRTRAMSILVAQMRALGQAAFPFRGELAFTDDPGCRLAALAIAQVQPDPNMLSWIATRIGPSERPFLQYHAIQALLVAARIGSVDQVLVLDSAYRIARTGYDALPQEERTDRSDLLDDLGSEIGRLRSAVAR